MITKGVQSVDLAKRPNLKGRDGPSVFRLKDWEKRVYSGR